MTFPGTYSYLYTIDDASLEQCVPHESRADQEPLRRFIKLENSIRHWVKVKF